MVPVSGVFDRDSKGQELLEKPREPGTAGSASSKASTTGTTVNAVGIGDAVAVDATAKDAKTHETAEIADAAGTEEGAGTEAGKIWGPGTEAKPEVEPAPEPVVTSPPRPAPRQSAFFPLLFGGIVAAVFGAAALRYGILEGWVEIGGGKTAGLQAMIDAQTAQITGLEAALEGLRTELVSVRDAAPDPGLVTGALDEVATRVGGVSDGLVALGQRLDATDARLAGLETQPIPKAELPAEMVAAYEARLAGLQGTMDERFDRMQDALNARLAEIEAAASDAGAAAKTAEARVALAEIEAALDSGTGFAEPLNALAETANVTPPVPLAETAETGVPSLASLQAEFPAAARAALTEATRAATSDGSINWLTAFFRTQMGARSLEPREGDDPDAVLSRAEAATGRGDLDTALTEIATLPAGGRAELANWAARAETRRTALAAAKTLSEQLNSN